MPLSTCPGCGLEFDTDASPAMPFCSQRCRLIDLGHWLNEEHALPLEPDEETAEKPWDDEAP